MSFEPNNSPTENPPRVKLAPTEEEIRAAEKELAELQASSKRKLAQIEKIRERNNEIDSLIEKLNAQIKLLPTLKSEKGRKEMQEKITALETELDIAEYPFKWYVIGGMSDRNYELIFGTDNKDAAVINKDIYQDNLDGRTCHFFDNDPEAITNERDNAISFSSNGFYLRLKNKDALGDDVVLEGPDSRYDLINPQGNIVAADLTYKEGQEKLTNEAVPYHEKEWAQFLQEPGAIDISVPTPTDEDLDKEEQALTKKIDEQTQKIIMMKKDFQHELFVKSGSQETSPEWTEADEKRLEKIEYAIDSITTERNKKTENLRHWQFESDIRMVEFTTTQIELLESNPIQYFIKDRNNQLEALEYLKRRDDYTADEMKERVTSYNEKIAEIQRTIDALRSINEHATLENVRSEHTRLLEKKGVEKSRPAGTERVPEPHEAPIRPFEPIDWIILGTKISYEGKNYEVIELPSEENGQKYKIREEGKQTSSRISILQLKKELGSGNVTFLPPPERKENAIQIPEDVELTPEQFNAMIADIKAQMDTLIMQKNERKTRIAELEQLIREEKERIAHMGKERSALVEAIQADKDSKSWKPFDYFIASKIPKNNLVYGKVALNKFDLIDLRFKTWPDQVLQQPMLINTGENEGFFIWDINGFILVITNIKQAHVDVTKPETGLTSECVYKIIHPNGTIGADNIHGIEEAKVKYNQLTEEYRKRIKDEFDRENAEQ